MYWYSFYMNYYYVLILKIHYAMILTASRRRRSCSRWRSLSRSEAAGLSGGAAVAAAAAGGEARATGDTLGDATSALSTFRTLGATLYNFFILKILKILCKQLKHLVLTYIRPNDSGTANACTGLSRDYLKHPTYKICPYFYLHC